MAQSNTESTLNTHNPKGSLVQELHLPWLGTYSVSRLCHVASLCTVRKIRVWQNHRRQRISWKTVQPASRKWWGQGHVYLFLGFGHLTEYFLPIPSFVGIFSTKPPVSFKKWAKRRKQAGRVLGAFTPFFFHFEKLCYAKNSLKIPK